MEQKELSWLQKNSGWIMLLLGLLLVGCIYYIVKMESPKEAEVKSKIEANKVSISKADSTTESIHENGKKASKKVVSSSIRASQDYKVVKDTNRHVMIKKILSYD